MSINEQQPGLVALVSRDDFRAARPIIFPSSGSLEWFIREHRAALIGAGAIALLRQRWFINPAAFDCYLLKVGAAAAAKRAPA